MTTPPILRTPRHLAFATVGLLTLSACSSNGGSATGGMTTTITHPSTGGGKTTSSTGTAGATTTGTGGGSTCPPAMKYGGGELMLQGSKEVKAKIVDETGTPIAAGQPVYICGIDICSPPAMTAAGGIVDISTMMAHEKPAFKVGDAINYAEFAIPITMLGLTDLTAGGTQVINTAKLQGKPGATLTPGADAVSGDVTISIPAGATVGIDQLVYDTPDKQMLRTASIPIANEGPWLASAGVTFSLLYGLAPAETPICPAAKVTVALPHAQMMPNDLGWVAGDKVEFWIMTTDTGQTYAPYAGWAKMSDGVVSTDGKSVSTVDSGGFIYLENFAIRKP